MVIGLVLYNGSVLAEVVRAGILAAAQGPDRGVAGDRAAQDPDDDASILLPQALTAMLPAVVSQLVVIVKDTALGGILVGYVELRRAASTSASNYGNLLPTYIVIAVIYIVLNLALTTCGVDRWRAPAAAASTEVAHRGRRRVTAGQVVGEIDPVSRSESDRAGR